MKEKSAFYITTSLKCDNLCHDDTILHLSEILGVLCYKERNKNKSKFVIKVIIAGFLEFLWELEGYKNTLYSPLIISGHIPIHFKELDHSLTIHFRRMTFDFIFAFRFPTTF